MAVGRKFLAQWMPAHDRKSFLHGHLAWHVALTNLDEGDLDGALAIYEQHIKPAGRPYPPLNIFTDGASLLWRGVVRRPHPTRAGRGGGVGVGRAKHMPGRGARSRPPVP